MINVQVVEAKKLLRVELTGHISPREIADAMQKLEEVFKKHKNKELKFLGISKCIAFAPDTTKDFEGMSVYIAQNCNKLATVHENVIAKKQLSRVTEKEHVETNKFGTEEEAMEYLYR